MLNKEIVCEIDPKVILETVCEALRIDQSEVLGSRRFPYLVDARIIVSYLLRKHSDWSFPHISRFMKKADHGVIVYYLKRHEELSFSCTVFRAKVDLVKNTLRVKGYDC